MITQKQYMLFLGVVFVQMLLVACTSIGVSTGSYPPFIQAVRAGDVAEADRLFRQGHLPGQTTIGNQTALHIAAAEGNDEMVRWLLAREAHPLAQDQNGRTPIDFAQRQGHTDTAQLILDYVDLVQREEEAIAVGADVNALNFLHNPPIYHAIMTDNADMVALLLEAEADVKIRSAIQGETMIEYAERKNNPEIVNLFNQFQDNR